MDKLEFKTRKIQCPSHGEQEERGMYRNWFGCPACSVEREKSAQAQAKAQAKTDILRSIGLPVIYQQVTFNGWDKTDERQMPVLRRAREFADQLSKIPNSPNLILSGNTGTGKTHIAACIARFTALRMIRCKYLPSAEFIAEIRSSWDIKSRTKSESEIIQFYGNIPVLIIDEMGVGDTVKGQHDIWSSLFDQRYRNKLPTIITTNLVKTDLEKMIGDRAYDRLMQNCVWANCVWQSYRQTKARMEEV